MFSWNFLDGLYTDFVRNGVPLDLNLDSFNGIAEDSVPYLGIGFLNQAPSVSPLIWGVNKSIFLQTLVTDVGTIETEGAEIEGVGLGDLLDGLYRNGSGDATGRCTQ